MNQRHPEDGEEKIPCIFPRTFLRLAKDYYHVDPVRIAEALIYSFALNPPRDLILVQRGTPKAGAADQS